jgi:beta-lactam-binding protein with PASTA domain
MPADDTAGTEIREDDRPTESAPRRKGAVALIVLLILLLVTCCAIGLSQMSEVPDVTGMTEDEARAALEKAGFEARIVSGDEAAGSEDSDGSPALRIVLSQSPAPGDRFIRGTRVSLTLGETRSGSTGDDDSSGSDGASGTYLPPTSDSASDDDGFTVVPGSSSDAPDSRPVIPMVGNTTESSAIAALQNAGYRVTVRYGRSTAGILEGYVYAQEPGFETRADRGTLITLWVSTGVPHQDGYEGVPYPGPGY